MSLKDDFLRNRRVFELLTEPEGSGTVSALLPHQSTFSQPISAEPHDAEPSRSFAPEVQESGRPSARPQDSTPQQAELFSLEFGRRLSRETGMSLSPPVLEGIAFPELRKPAAPVTSTPLEGLYHRLETDARRMSQLLGEEEY